MSYTNNTKDQKPESAFRDALVRQADKLTSQTQEMISQGEKVVAEFKSLTPEEAAWVDWFNSLSEEHKQLVEACAEKDLFVTPDNIGAVLDFLNERDKRKND